MRPSRLLLVLPVVAAVVFGCGGSAATPATSASRATESGSAAPSGVAGSSAPRASSGRSAAASVAVVPAASPSKPIVSVKGTGFVDSKTFKLKAGDYEVRWSLTSTSSAGCMALAAIRTPDGKVSVEVANTKVSGKGTLTGYEVAPNLKAATYLVSFATTCSWTAQIYAQ